MFKLWFFAFMIEIILIKFWSTTAQSLQRFISEPNNQTGVLGEKAVLPCRVLNKAGTLQWTRDGFGLGIERSLYGFPRYTMIGSDDTGDYSLEINSVSLEDDASFQCQVGVGDGVPAIRSRIAYFTVFVAPETPIIVQARAQGHILKTTAGTNIELTCESHGGKPAPELLWVYLDGSAINPKNLTYTAQPLNDGKRWNSYSKWTFIASKDFDNKTIVCRSENSALKQPLQTSIRLDVKYAPEVQLKIVSQMGQVKAGDNIELICEANANPNQLIYKWFINDEVVVGDHNTKLVLNGVDKQLNGQIVSCEVSNIVGSNKGTHKLDISYGPILKSPTDIVYGVDAGRDLRIRCDVEGNPKPDITWLKEGQITVLNTEPELLIKSVTEDKIGKYICRASIKGFPEVSLQLIVGFNGAPKIQTPYSYYGLVGHTVRIGCYIDSFPKPSSIIWYHNSRTIVTIDRNAGIDIIEERIPGEATIVSTLIIQNAKPSDFGDYNCTARNQFGVDSKIISLAERLSFSFMVTIVSAMLSILVIIVLITIITILCLRHKLKTNKSGTKKSPEFNESSTESTDSDEPSNDSLISEIDSESEDNIDVEMESNISSELSVKQNRVQNKYFTNTSNDILFDYDFNQSFRQYI